MINRFLFFFIIISNQLFAQNTKEGKDYYYTHQDQQLKFHLKHSKVSSPILSINTKKAFLTIAHSAPKVKEVYGFFKFKEKFSKTCKNQSIDTILSQENGIQIKGQLCDGAYQCDLSVLDSSSIQIKVTLSDSSYNRIYFVYNSTPQEAIFGLGEQYTHSNLKGKKVPIWVEEQGIGAGDQPITAIANVKIAGGTPVSTYAPIPFYISNHNYSFTLNNSSRAVFDFRKKAHTTLEVWDHQLEAILKQSSKPLDLIEAHTETMGRQPQLPDWAYGTIVGLQGGTEKVVAYVDSLEASDVEISAIWIQDWVGRRRTFVGDQLRWYWQADEQRYPNFKQFCKNMNARGITVLGYINPMLTNDGPLYKEADEKGYLVQNHLKETYVIQMTGFKVGLIDLTNPAACTWIKNVIKNNMIAYGLEGWMADFGEALPWDAVLHSGISAELYHNQYPVNWARINREAIQEANKEGEIAFFSRSAFQGSSKYVTLYWAGDQMTSWQKNDGLRSIVPALTSSGISGMAINHADVGGFAGFWKVGGLFQMHRSEKLLQRHIELGAFTPVYRTHEGILPKKNAQVYSNKSLSAFYAKFSQIRKKLVPYLKELNLEATEKGYPMIRHLYLHYPKDVNSQKATYQFLLGKDILVAPNLKKTQSTVKVYLPQGTWRHLLTNVSYQGGQYHRIKAPLGIPPVFINTSSSWNEKIDLLD
jgi:alpha-glucosidase